MHFAVKGSQHVIRPYYLYGCQSWIIGWRPFRWTNCHSDNFKLIILSESISQPLHQSTLICNHKRNPVIIITITIRKFGAKLRQNCFNVMAIIGAKKCL